jgi:hypothetical protein
MSDESKPFIWAHDVQANVKEPIQELRERGWRYGDVPAASNFNWIFKTMTQEIALLKNELAAQREQFTRSLLQQAAHQEKLLNKIKKLREEVSIIDESQRDDATQLSRSLESTWELLRGMGDVTRQYHPNFPTTPWPSRVFPDRNGNG